MNLSTAELTKEKERLNYTLEIIKKHISGLGQELYNQDEKVSEFQKFIWDNKSSLDPHELKSLMSDNDLEVYLMTQKGKYFKNYLRFKIIHIGSIILKM